LCLAVALSSPDGRHSAVALLLKAALIQVSGGTTRHNFGRGPSNDYFIKVWFQLSNWFQTRRFLCEFPIGFYVKLSSAVVEIFSSETTGSIATKLWWNSPWKAPFQKCVW
jgi:hypothetical protein